nr:B3 domain-containing protein Os03g0212300-like [Aegilops tauschii subsp. strangulata]
MGTWEDMGSNWSLLLLIRDGGRPHRRLRSATPEYNLEGFEFFTIILENSSRRQRLPDIFMKMLDGHRPKNVKLRQAGSGLHGLWDVEVVFRYDHMYLCRGWEQFVHAYDLRHMYFLVLRYDGNTMLTVKVFNMTMCRMHYQDDDDASNGSSSSDSGYSKSSSDSSYSKSSSEDEEEWSGEEEEQSGDEEVQPILSDDDLAMLGDRPMPIVVEEYIPLPCRSKRIRMMKEKEKKEE